MARLIDADKLLTKVVAVSNSMGQVTWSAVSTIDILTAPTVDAVEVVRCKNCRKRHTWECAMHYESDDGKEQYGWENDNDFCSCGERKEGDGNG